MHGPQSTQCSRTPPRDPAVHSLTMRMKQLNGCLVTHAHLHAGLHALDLSDQLLRALLADARPPVHTILSHASKGSCSCFFLESLNLLVCARATAKVLRWVLGFTTNTNLCFWETFRGTCRAAMPAQGDLPACKWGRRCWLPSPAPSGSLS